jgi:hypothetical protein
MIFLPHHAGVIPNMRDKWIRIKKSYLSSTLKKDGCRIDCPARGPGPAVFHLRDNLSSINVGDQFLQ